MKCFDLTLLAYFLATSDGKAGDVVWLVAIRVA